MGCDTRYPGIIKKRQWDVLIEMFDVYKEKCPSRVVLEIISNKWVILIIEKLAIRAHRFGELKREIEGVSAKVLSQQLKCLEANGLVLRQDHSAYVLYVEYSLTSLGLGLSEVCRHITRWAEQHVNDLQPDRDIT